ncbi:hypothetical protein E4191_19080 (plasmid) [Paracoccus liaowanqingii]|uniref:Uncharacterized protein n=1 Tax=Paracoccus liaowanqingii TaxID=2560053 RepID=A0A4Y5STX6_9RHOB|nr:hypothetical protein [Paracoccus liaowanqingii]QDA36225.1 hypothetical protein E4191_19080 [Paracoccus liaowanqingii]
MNAIYATDSGLSAVATQTPIMNLFREWENLRKEEGPVYNISPTGEDEETKALNTSLHERESTIMAAPCQIPLDFVAKIIVWTGYGIHALPDAYKNPDFWADARRLIGGAA